MKIVSYSQLRSFSRCQWQWGARYLKTIYPKKQSDPLDIGKLVHNALAQFYGFGEIDWEILRSEFVGDLRPEVLAESKRVVDAYLKNGKAEFPGKVLAVEFPFQVKLPFDTILVAWIDLIARVNEKLWLWDHKTSGRMTYGITHPEREQLSLYSWGLSKLGAPIGGFGVNRLTTTKKPTFARFFDSVYGINRTPTAPLSTFGKLSEELSDADLQARSKSFVANCKALPPEGISMVDLTRSFQDDCSYRCDYKSLCELDLYGRIEDMSKVVAEEFTYAERGDTEAYLEKYCKELPKWWLEDE